MFNIQLYVNGKPVCFGSSASRIDDRNDCCTGNITRTTPNQEITKKYVSITDSGMITHSGSDRRITRSEKSTRYSDSGSATTCIEMVTNQKIGRVSRTNTQDCAASSRTVSLHEELSLLDIYSGCGGLSAGLCMGACFSGINIATVS